ncbi:Deoxyuridine 5'-triphosphate nucleotidohydrolase [Flexistipes sinusarabici DSM 4947]|uniref:Deoxyuridine 5'-triphosphate nucleotidohydrolase n=2 Tax=Flexistipes sinusarabici TaxID=2352 RepID=F8E8C7_FLESM|nr:dUTP diphosphatase [Flexistipes sinusarabici]AEI15124.1 Deoxyuridine 5'-triphosphate nucleotidohydrolase [Flexistipes sinusarabici DSM 4947]HCW93325.1 dUTP diphosphatase [Flexistipes sinusarabici]
MKKINVKIQKTNDSRVPVYKTEESAGADLFAAEAGVVKAGKIKLVKTGVSFSIPEGYEAQIRPRSGLALKKGVTILNTPGTIDSDYRGEVGVILVNFGDNDFVFNTGDRIAQVVFSKVYRAEFTLSDELDTTERGSGGFGHTGF